MFPTSEFLIYCFVAAYTPGANNLLSMSSAARMGFRRSYPFNLGVTAGFLIVMILCTVFSTALHSALPALEGAMRFVGAGYMLYLAWKVMRSSADLEAKGAGTASFLSGMLLQFVNPKIYIYAVTAMSLYILPCYHSIPALAAFTLVLTVIGASGTYAWALFGTVLCRFLRAHERAVNLAMALLLVYCAVGLFL